MISIYLFTLIIHVDRMIVNTSFTFISLYFPFFAKI